MTKFVAISGGMQYAVGSIHHPVAVSSAKLPYRSRSCVPVNLMESTGSDSFLLPDWRPAYIRRAVSRTRDA